MKDIYTSKHIWMLFENFLVDMAVVGTDCMWQIGEKRGEGGSAWVQRRSAPAHGGHRADLQQWKFLWFLLEFHGVLSYFVLGCCFLGGMGERRLSCRFRNISEGACPGFYFHQFPAQNPFSMTAPFPGPQVCNSTTDRKHADVQLENYVTDTVMNIITTFFSSPFSDQSTNLQVGRAAVVCVSIIGYTGMPIFRYFPFFPLFLARSILRQSIFRFLFSLFSPISSFSF